MTAIRFCDRCEHPENAHDRDGCRRKGCPCDGYWPRPGSETSRPDAFVVALTELTAAVRTLTAELRKRGAP